MTDHATKASAPRVLGPFPAGALGPNSTDTRSAQLGGMSQLRGDMEAKARKEDQVQA